jgi:3-deoxy-D-manno-octulosonate 8-phosphate phosphatase (KDO 8-P phosphatase)
MAMYPARTFAPELLLAAQGIKLAFFDVDGVMTDGGIYLGAAGGTSVELKRYEIQDGLGVHLMQRAGLRVAIVTGRVSESVRLRAIELGVDDVAQDANAQKLPAFLAMLDRHGIAPSEAAFVGDDFPDLAVLRLVGLPVCVGNAVPEIRAECKLQLTRSGGAGAVRELAETLLEARGQWTQVTEAYVRERSLPLGEPAS